MKFRAIKYFAGVLFFFIGNIPKLKAQCNPFELDSIVMIAAPEQAHSAKKNNHRQYANVDDSTQTKKKRKRNNVVVARFTVKYKPADTTPFYTIDPWWLWTFPKNSIWQSGSDLINSTNSNQETPFIVGNQLYGGPGRRVDPMLIYWRTSDQLTNSW